MLWKLLYFCFLLPNVVRGFGVISPVVIPRQTTTTSLWSSASDDSIPQEITITVSKQDLKKNEEGLGLSLGEAVFQSNEKVFVQSVAPGSIAEDLGIQANWVVTAINTENTLQADAETVAALVAEAVDADISDPLVLQFRAPTMKDTDEEEANDKKLAKKVEGRKKRVIMGYRATSFMYILSALRLLKRADWTPIYLSAAAGPLMVAGLAYILSTAAANDRLSSDTYKRLNLAMGSYGVLGLILIGNIMFKKGEVYWFILGPLLACINSVKGYAYGVLGWDKKGTTSLASDLVGGVKDSVKGMLTIPKNLTAGGYWIATMILAGMQVSTLRTLLSRSIESTAGNIILLSQWGRWFVLTNILYTLKDAADRGRLQGTTFIELNVLTSLALAFVATGVGIQKALGGSLAMTSLFAGITGITSIVKKQKKE